MSALHTGVARPRLTPGWHIVPLGDSNALRSAFGILRLPVLADEDLALFHALDGTQDLVGLIGQRPATAMLRGLALIQRLADAGLLRDGPTPPVRMDLVPPPRPLLTANDGLLATALREQFPFVDERPAPPAPCVMIGCRDRIEMSLIERDAALARAAGIDYLSVLPMGDAVLIGPVVRAGEGPCPRCVLTRWIAISPDPDAEAAFLEATHAGLVDTALSASRAAAVALAAAPIIADLLAHNVTTSEAVLTSIDGARLSHGPCHPRPGCLICGPSPSKTVARECWPEEQATLKALRPKLLPFARGPCALVRTNGSRSDLGQHIAVARFAAPDPLSGTAADGYWCHGSGATGEEAETIATIEGLERHCGLQNPPPGVHATYASLQDDALDPEALPLYSNRQYAQADFPFDPFDATQEIDWSSAFNLSTGRPILIPTSAIWYAADSNLLTECSSGIAAHSAPGTALVHAALELVERDAFMIHWLHRLAPPAINANKLNARSHALADTVRSSGYQVHLLDLTTDLHLPVALALGTRRDGLAPALILGAGAAFSLEQALEKALREMAAALAAPGHDWRPELMDVGDVARLADHSRAYAHPDWLPAADFLWSSERFSTTAVAPSASISPLADLLERLAAGGLDLIGAELTSDEIRAAGLFVVRALIPGLVPLGISPAHRLGGRRLYETPGRMGYNQYARIEEGLYDIPHCFP